MPKQSNLKAKVEQLHSWKKGTSYIAKALNISELEVKDILGSKYELPKLIKEQVSDDSTQITYVANRPLTQKEVESLYHVDNITSKLATCWHKEKADGKFLTSALIKYLAKGLNHKDLEKKLLSIFPTQKAFRLPKVNTRHSKEALVILISDDHCGMVNPKDIYNSGKWTENKYEFYLRRIVGEVMALNKTFDEVHILSLGDQMNGWNQQTTRGGHIVKSTSNEQQFDMYTKARVVFYDLLFTSKISNSYHLHEVDNSNHSGLGLSYMANKFLKLYVEQRFPQVVVTSHDFIDHFQYGKHVVMFTHGKDEMVQKSPFPYAINDRTDAYIQQYAQSKGYNCALDHITFYKGDLHTYGIQQARFGRYVNIPAISGNSDYGDINFANTKAGALLEIYSADSNTIKTQPVWLS